MGHTTTVSKFHDSLAQAVLPLRGREVSPAEIKQAFVDAFPQQEDQKDWVMPSDHCRNHTNKGACECAQTERALFEQLERGRYRVL